MRKVLFILGQLNDSDVEWLSNAGTRRTVPAGEVLINEGVHLDTLYLILEGQMSVASGGFIFAKVASGDFLGEMSMLDSGRTSASVVCDINSTVLAVPKTLLDNRLSSDSGFAARFYKALALFLADRMRNTILHLGYGKLSSEQARDEDARDLDELDVELLDNVHLAGARFDRILKKLMA